MANRKDMPVYLFTGFLEAGKTRFIQETLEDRRFCNGEKTLLLLCEEGEEEYEPDEFASKTVTIRVLEDPSDLTPDHLAALAGETNAERIVIEYNGMWMLDSLYSALPEGWMVYQEFFFADSRTILQYNSNMRQLVYDKLKSCELVVFNRFDPGMDKMEYHKLVRAASPRADIAFEYPDGKVEYDDIVDPLPFDLDAPVVEIGDEHYALWYRDLSEEPKKYEGKTVRFKCRALVSVEGCQKHPGRLLDDPDRGAPLQVQPRIRKEGTGPDLSVFRALRAAGKPGCDILLIQPCEYHEVPLPGL